MRVSRTKGANERNADFGLWRFLRVCTEVKSHLQSFKCLHELLQLIRWKKITNEMLPFTHLCQLLCPLWYKQHTSFLSMPRAHKRSNELIKGSYYCVFLWRQSAVWPLVFSISICLSLCSQVPASESTSSSLSYSCWWFLMAFSHNSCMSCIARLCFIIMSYISCIWCVHTRLILSDSLCVLLCTATLIQCWH